MPECQVAMTRTHRCAAVCVMMMAVTCLWLVDVASAQTNDCQYYADVTGDGDACTQRFPCKSIQQAIDLAIKCNTTNQRSVIIAPGQYTESLTVSDTNKLTLTGSNNTTDETIISPVQNDPTPVLVVTNVVDLTLQGLTFTGRNGTNGVQLDNTVALISGCVFSHHSFKALQVTYSNNTNNNNNGGKLIIEGSTFNSNRRVTNSSCDGGAALHIDGIESIISTCLFENNSALRIVHDETDVCNNVGAIWTNANIEVKNTDFTSNTGECASSLFVATEQVSTVTLSSLIMQNELQQGDFHCSSRGAVNLYRQQQDTPAIEQAATITQMQFVGTENNTVWASTAIAVMSDGFNAKIDQGSFKTCSPCVQVKGHVTATVSGTSFDNNGVSNETLIGLSALAGATVTLDNVKSNTAEILCSASTVTIKDSMLTNTHFSGDGCLGNAQEIERCPKDATDCSQCESNSCQVFDDECQCFGAAKLANWEAWKPYIVFGCAIGFIVTSAIVLEVVFIIVRKRREAQQGSDQYEQVSSA